MTPLVLQLSVTTTLALIATATPAAAQPSGCFELALMVPKQFDHGFTTTDVSAHELVASGNEICVTGKPTKPAHDNIAPGTWSIEIKRNAKTIATYKPTAMAIDGSGNHDDFVFASDPAILKSADLDGYPRGRRGPIENTIFFILLTDVKTGPLKRAAGDYIGLVAIGDAKFALLVKS